MCSRLAPYHPIYVSTCPHTPTPGDSRSYFQNPWGCLQCYRLPYFTAPYNSFLSDLHYRIYPSSLHMFAVKDEKRGTRGEVHGSKPLRSPRTHFPPKHIIFPTKLNIRIGHKVLPQSIPSSHDFSNHVCRPCFTPLVLNSKKHTGP